MPNYSYRDKSKTNYGNSDPSASFEEINTGSLQRIADAVEKMTQPFVQMMGQLQQLREINVRLTRDLEKKDNSIRVLKGHITRLKNEKELSTDTKPTE